MTFIAPRFEMLRHEDCLRIHLASRKILHDTGVEIFHDEGLRILRDAGVNSNGRLVKFPPTLIEWALSTVPNSFDLYSRGGEQVALQLDGENVYFGPGSDTLRYLDPRSGIRRDFRIEDIADCVRIAGRVARNWVRHVNGSPCRRTSRCLLPSPVRDTAENDHETDGGGLQRSCGFGSDHRDGCRSCRGVGKSRKTPHVSGLFRTEHAITAFT